MKNGALSIIIILVLFISGLSFLLDGTRGQEEGEDIADWTFMVYLDADNNLEDAGIDDMNEMEKIGSTAMVSMLAW